MAAAAQRVNGPPRRSGAAAAQRDAFYSTAPKRWMRGSNSCMSSSQRML
jgi:hypothetical protein